MGFHDVRLDENVSKGARGGPLFNNQVLTNDAGYEKIISRWSQVRHRYDVGYGIQTLKDITEIKKFYLARGGAANSFRYKDWSDFTSTSTGLAGSVDNPAITAFDQVIGQGDGSEVDFQLIKTYTSGGIDRIRNITKPVNGTITVAIDGVIQASGWTLDYSTGVLTFAVAPGSGLDVSWGGEFDVHARFGENADRLLNIGVEQFTAGQITGIDLIEKIDNEVLNENFFMGGSNSEVLTSTKQLQATDARFQLLNPSGGDVDVIMPAATSEWPGGGPYFYIYNNGSNNLRMMSPYTKTLITTIGAGAKKQALLFVDGSTQEWYFV